MKNTILALTVATFSLAFTNEASAEYRKSSVNSGISLPRVSTQTTLPAFESGALPLLAELDSLMAELEMLQEEYSLVAAMKPQPGDSKSKEDYYDALKEWLKTLKQIGNDINAVEKEIEFVEDELGILATDI